MKKKIYYIPGLISLLGLPLLLIFYFPEEKAPPNSVRLLLPLDDTNAEKDGNLKFSKYSISQSIKKKKIVSIALWNDLPLYDEHAIYRQNSKMIFVETEMKRLQFTHDTTSVLKIELGEYNTYSDFIYLINLALIHQVKRYAYVDNDFYFFANPPPEPPGSVDPITIELDVISNVPLYKPPTQWELFTRKVENTAMETIYYVKHNCLIVSALLVFIFIPAIIRIRKYMSVSLLN